MTADLFHIGHLIALEKCALRGKVIVGLLTDEVIESYKGEKPIIPFEQRKAILEALNCVDEVRRQDSLKPDLTGMDFVASGDGFEDKEKEAAKEAGCKLLDVGPKKYSTTEIKQKICQKVKEEKSA